MRPDVTAPAAWRFPTARRHFLDNGIRVLVHDLPGQHVVSISAVLDLPLASEPADLEGISSITLRCLDEGTAHHPGTSFAEALEDHGAALGGRHSLSGAELSVDCPSARLPEVMALVADAWRRPTLDDADVARQVALRLGEIDQTRANAAALAGQEFRDATFQSRAQRPNGGTADTVASITGTAVRTWHRDHWGPAATTIVIGGDFSGLDPLAVVAESFGDWSHTVLPLSPAAVETAPVTHRVVDRPGSVQSALALGRLAPDRSDDRWADLQVAVHAIGGSFGSRVNSVLREEKGWTYGSRLATTPMRSGGFTTLTGSFRTEVTADAIRTAVELMDITDTPLTAPEVNDARGQLLAMAPMQYATADAVVSQTVDLCLSGLPLDWLDGHFSRLAAVTPESADAAWQTASHHNPWRLVVVGAADRLTERLRADGWQV